MMAWNEQITFTTTTEPVPEIHNGPSVVLAPLHLTVDNTGILAIAIDVVNFSVISSLGQRGIQDVVDVDCKSRV